MKVEESDIVVIASDGVADNLNECYMKNLIRMELFKGSGPKDVARLLVEKAISANMKPDDTSCVIWLCNTLIEKIPIIYSHYFGDRLVCTRGRTNRTRITLCDLRISPNDGLMCQHTCINCSDFYRKCRP